MCTADVAQRGIFKRSSTTTTVRFGTMKLPRCNAFPSSSTTIRGGDQLSSSQRGSSASRQGQQQEQEQEQHDETTTTTNTPRASGRTTNDSSHRHNGRMIRSQSANAAKMRHRFVMAGMRAPSMHKSRSHSQESSSHHCQQQQAAAAAQQEQQQRTQEVAIPPYQPGHRGPSITVDKNDLTRMYDYATWNMYERIVNARRRRLTEMDAQQQGSSSPTSSCRPSESQVSSTSSQSNGAFANEATPAIDMGTSADNSNKPLNKTPSHDESSTLATADETDKSSTTSSSWSRTDSPGTYPGLAYHMGYERAVSSCPPPNDEYFASGEEDHFIFQLDM